MPRNHIQLYASTESFQETRLKSERAPLTSEFSTPSAVGSREATMRYCGRRGNEPDHHGLRDEVRETPGATDTDCHADHARQQGEDDPELDPLVALPCRK
jgi:hypothetical protein